MIPSPRNITQSKMVFKALQKFGDVATFLNLKVRHTIRLFVFFLIQIPERGYAALI
jgi:hypothetical protein